MAEKLEMTFLNRPLYTFLVVGVLFSLGCTHKIPIAPKVGVVDYPASSREAVLVIPFSEAGYVHFASPQGRNDYTAEFPIGQALSMAALDVYSQVFSNIKIVHSLQQVPSGALAITPKFSGSK